MRYRAFFFTHFRTQLRSNMHHAHRSTIGSQTGITVRGFWSSDMLAKKPKTKILVDGGDPDETLRIKKLLGFVDGQTTNPSLSAKNPEVRRLIASGHRLSSKEEKDEYKRIVQTISPLVGDAGVSIEVFADLDTRAEDMLAQGR